MGDDHHLVCIPLGMLIPILVASFLVVGWEWSYPMSETELLECHANITSRYFFPAKHSISSYVPASEIIRGVWLGNVCAAFNRSFLKNNNITTMVSTLEAFFEIRQHLAYTHRSDILVQLPYTTFGVPVPTMLDSHKERTEFHVSNGVLYYSLTGVDSDIINALASLLTLRHPGSKLPNAKKNE